MDNNLKELMAYIFCQKIMSDIFEKQNVFFDIPEPCRS